LKIKK